MKVNEWKKMYCANSMPKKAEVSIVSDKRKTRKRLLQELKRKGNFMMIKGLIH